MAYVRNNEQRQECDSNHKEHSLLSMFGNKRIPILEFSDKTRKRNNEHHQEAILIEENSLNFLCSRSRGHPCQVQKRIKGNTNRYFYFDPLD